MSSQKNRGNIPVLKCKECGKELTINNDIYRFNDKRLLNGRVVKTHWYLCRSCALEEVTPTCENVKENCVISKPGDPELRISKLRYDGGRGETYCKSCGLVQDEVSISSMNGISNHHFPKPKEPKEYIRTVQELANDSLVDWFNYTEKHSLFITCKEENAALVADKHPSAKIIII